MRTNRRVITAGRGLLGICSGLGGPAFRTIFILVIHNGCAQLGVALLHSRGRTFQQRAC
jgi:hypothetical protein